MNSIVWLTFANTLKLRGHIRGEEVIVLLVDSGAFHNFISRSLLQKLALLVDRTKTFRLMVGNGFTVRSIGVCRGLELHMQGLSVMQFFFSL
ncbi:hypothetical protein Patl1_25202 [Pistacia atlantica]|uniref:Uncharacterized protein n=1 Tax=Pistacia atlantica TaxID=434234 RepID=A0ACC1B4J1_9ROSI|nr:hypothetical protein Patl1_25202 [Pistacia atlantica]